MMKDRTSGFLYAVVSLLAAFMVSGCATSAPRLTFIQEIPASNFVAAGDSMKADVEAQNNVIITDLEKTRIQRVIEEKIAAKQALNAKTGDARNYEVNVVLTRYDKGNAFARAMLAGLGAIHIDGIVKLLELPDKNKIGEFTIQKTFAWGGAYGASMTIEEIEKTFAEGIASAVTGRSEEAPSRGTPKADEAKAETAPKPDDAPKSEVAPK